MGSRNVSRFDANALWLTLVSEIDGRRLSIPRPEPPLNSSLSLYRTGDWSRGERRDSPESP
jgi:hypothetical protein